MAVTSWKLCRRAAGGWTNQNNILADDGAVASSNVGAGSQTPILVGDDFGFSDSDIPSGATIDGIEVRIEASKWPYAMSAILASLRKSLGTNVGDNKSASISLTNSLTKFTLGGATDKWGTTWTDSDVKQSSFGFAYRAQNNDGKYSVDANVDCIEVRVHYTAAASPPVVTNNTASAVAGVGGTVQMSATNTPTSWSLPGSPPTGVSINSSGLVTWTTATPAGVHSITVRATNAGGSGDGTLTLTITAASPRAVAVAMASQQSGNSLRNGV